MATKIDRVPSSSASQAPEACCPELRGSPLSESEAEEISKLLKALADPVRLRLVSAIAASETGEVCACDLPGLLDRTQGTVSHHLGQLVKANVLSREQRGKWAWFRIRAESFDIVRVALGLTSS